MDPPDPEPQLRPLQERRSKKELTREVRQYIVSRLLSELKDHGDEGRFVSGTISVIAQDFQVYKRTIRRVWAQPLKNLRIQTFVSFARVPKNTGVGDPRSGPMTTFETL
jgi:hypothetical protein